MKCKNHGYRASRGRAVVKIITGPERHIVVLTLRLTFVLRAKRASVQHKDGTQAAIADL